ncbi:capsule biosynthesis protein [Paracoccus sp. (in: a-proteobacteria)]|uniref:capsule biosynthesis protein n=1 Tax=Paracoccus sp. TaxID=267 RepID=UPI0035B4BB27
MTQDRHDFTPFSKATPEEPHQKVFLLLQGPHGPFFDRLGRLLCAAGAQVWRCAFNAGDEFFWSDKARLLRHQGSSAEWPARLAQIIAEKGVTDIVLYGDVRPVHAAARSAAQALGLRLHVFEEGYLRPYWISYERGGSNGHSALLGVSLDRMRATLRDTASEVRRPPAHWGDMRQHKFYGAFYHFLVLVANGKYRQFTSHRALSIGEEFRMNLRRLVLTPFHAATRAVQWRRFRLSGDPYVLVPMQLEHDSSLQGHSPFTRNSQFVEQVVAEFARSAPRHHHLLFKAHPLEDGRARNRRSIRKAAACHGVADRVHYFRGGKLADMLAHARAVITVNSTAAQQALWRGLPVKALGRAVYCKAGLVSEQGLPEFFRDPKQPDMGSYRVFRDYLLQTSQVPGGFYSRRSRAHALRLVADLILAPDDPYRALAAGRFQRRQQIGELLD